MPMEQEQEHQVRTSLSLQGVLPLKELRGDDLQIQAIQQSLRKALLDSVGQEP